LNYTGKTKLIRTEPRTDLDMTDKAKHNNKLSRRQILKYGVYGGLTGLSSSLWVGGCGKHWGRRKPNVVLIVLDTARADRFSCMGYHRNTSPNIDEVFSEGTIFEKAYSTACWTLPSHGSLFTGLYPTQAGSTSETLHLPKFNLTVAEILNQAGYKTAGFCCNSWVSKERGFANGFDEYHEMWRESEWTGADAAAAIIAELAATEKIVAWLKHRQTNSDAFFMFVNLNCVHLPYTPPDPFLSKFLADKYNFEDVERAASVMSMWAYLAGKLKLGEKDFQIMSDLYDGEVAFADYCVGRIIKQVEKLQILDDTIVILTSDHGENLGEHGRIDHNLSMYQTTLHIPLMIRYPAGFKAAGRISDLVSITDITPTILDLCNIKKSGMERLKIAETSLAATGRRRREFVVSGNERPLMGVGLMKERYPEFDTGLIDYRMRAVRSGNYKLIWNINVGTELYDIRTDPGELNDLADKKIAIRNKLQARLISWMNQHPPLQQVPSLLQGRDKESLKILRSLGYIR